MEIIEQIGSYAGLAAIVGLAVLSALYFSQARDVRRLRESEEAGGPVPAPLQPGQVRGPQRPTAAPVPGPPPTPAPGPAAAGAGQRPADQPAVAGAQERTAALAQHGADVKEKEPAVPPAAGAPAAAGGTQAPAPAGDPRPATPAASPGGNAIAAAAGGNAKAPPNPAKPQPPGRVAPAQGGTAAGARPAPPRLPSQRPGTAAATLRAGSVATSPGATRPPWHRRVAPRYLALIVAGLLVVSAGAVYAITALVGEDDGAVQVAAPGEGPRQATPLDPSTIEVAVLNGTQVPGLAEQVAETVESAGFQRGNVSNAPEQGGSAESVVLFADGARRPARQVGQELDIPQIEPLDAESEVLAGTADVTVIVGADRNE